MIILLHRHNNIFQRNIHHFSICLLFTAVDWHSNFMFIEILLNTFGKGLRRHWFMSNPIMFFCIMKYWLIEITVSRHNYRWMDNIAIVKSCLNMMWYFISFYWLCIWILHIVLQFYLAVWQIFGFTVGQWWTASLRPDTNYKV